MFKFPFGTLQELNLDWIIDKIREFAETGTKTKEPLKFTFSDGTEQTFDGEEAVTIDLAGTDISGKLDKYTGGVDTVYATIGTNQTNLPLPLGAQYGGTGVTSLDALKTALGLALEYVARRTTTGAWMYYHDGNTEGEKPLGYTPGADTVAMRNADGNVQTNDPIADKDAVNKQTFAALDDRVKHNTIEVNIASYTSSGATVSNAAITANHRVVECTLANPSVQTGDLLWTTAAGSLTLSGNVSAATAVTIVLVNPETSIAA